MKRTIWASVVGCVCAWTVAAIADEAAPVRTNKADVVIAAAKSAFKDAVVASVKQALGERKIEVRIVELPALRDLNVADHTAVVIVHAVHAWRPERSVRAFLDAVPAERRGRVILVSTAGDAKWRLKSAAGIHAVTTASTTAKAGETSAYVVGRIDEILRQP